MPVQCTLSMLHKHSRATSILFGRIVGADKSSTLDSRGIEHYWIFDTLDREATLLWIEVLYRRLYRLPYRGSHRPLPNRNRQRKLSV